jgi:hypothetical protein
MNNQHLFDTIKATLDITKVIQSLVSEPVLSTARARCEYVDVN